MVSCFAATNQRAMRPFYIIIALSLSLASKAQTFNADAKSTGTLKSTEGKFEGIIDVNFKNDQVLWRSDNISKLFSARQIKEIDVVDQNGNHSRYKSFEFEYDHLLFLVVTAGKIEILFKPGIIKDKITQTYFPDYFVVGKHKQLIPLEKKKDFIDAFGNDAKWMAQYIKNESLDMSRVIDISKAFEYYNNSFEATHPVP